MANKYATRSSVKTAPSVQHKYDPTDMPCIRLVRTKLLKSLRLATKSSAERCDRIAMAIVPMVDWDKISDSTDAASDETKDKIADLESAIMEFQVELQYHFNIT